VCVTPTGHVVVIHDRCLHVRGIVCDLTPFSAPSISFPDAPAIIGDGSWAFPRNSIGTSVAGAESLHGLKDGYHRFMRDWRTIVASDGITANAIMPPSLTHGRLGICQKSSEEHWQQQAISASRSRATSALRLRS